MLLIILGLLFIFFIPGFLITIIFFEKSEFLEKAILSVLLSIAFFVFLGVMLGFSETMKNITGGLSSLNLWIYSLGLNLLLFAYYLLRRTKKQKKISKK
jgi:uncharacterized membrane protein